MSKKKIILIISVAFLTFIYSFALIQIGIYYGEARKEQSEQAATVNHFIVKEYDNMIAVFEDGSDIPQKVLNIDVATLRKQDRLRFQEGIVVNSLDELAQLEEDFGS